MSGWPLDGGYPHLQDSSNEKSGAARPESFTGRKRNRRTSRLVRFADVLSRACITVGGVATIVAVSTVAVFLIWVAAPLFLPARVEGVDPVEARVAENPPEQFAVDEYQAIGWSIFDDGRLIAFNPATGAAIAPVAELNDPHLTAWSISQVDGTASFGFADGSVRLGRIAFRGVFIDESALPEAVQSLHRGVAAEHDHEGRRGVISRTSESQFRFQWVELELGDPIAVGKSPIALIDHAFSHTSRTFCALTETGELKIEQVTERRNILTREVTQVVNEGVLPYVPRAAGPPTRLLMSGLGDTVYLVWSDGLARRFDTRMLKQAQVVEEIDLVPEPGAELTTVAFLIGKTSLLVGDSQGQVGAWFRIKPENAQTSDGALLVRAHVLRGPPSAVTALSVSARSRLVLVGHADGTARVHQVTSHKLLADVDAGSGPIALASLAPKDDGLFLLSGGRLHRWSMDTRHPEATLAALFAPVWYEGYVKPAHVWQSSSGTDDFEEKFGLYPLIFGTIKATVYSLLFGVPLALLAAIYTSEFLHPRAKAAIKPAIEMMASLPSVVLGFLAALVIAPFVENVVPAVLVLFVALPVTFLVGAYAWQMLPQPVMLRLNRWRFAFILGLTPIGVLSAWLLGPLAEHLLFAGDIKIWLDGQIGSGLGAWMILFLPLSAVFAGLLMSRFVNPRLRPRARSWTRRQTATVDLIKFIASGVCTLTVALLISFLLTALGADPRGSFVDTYIQRNALVVGFIMGFAIIPIIYTIGEDALSTVPEHLRAASLGAGATRWQTAVRIILPTAMSGLFSAVMIGLGRAVGETMIVLMAAGNTPVMEWNMFNGFRTLSANIAVELPEAVRNSTHYRTLFLAALVLFALTFLLNTVAEIVRLRFRRRAYQL